MNSGLVLLLLGGFLLGGAYSVWSADEDTPTRTTPQLVVAVTLLLAALLATAAASSASSEPGMSAAAEQRFLRTVLADPTVAAVLDRAPALGVGDWWLTAGVLFQTVWNDVTGRPAGTGIRDADLFYFDADTSWEAEDAVIRAGAELFADLPVPVEIRNEARVHLWYADHFGVPAPAVPRLRRRDRPLRGGLLLLRDHPGRRRGAAGVRARTATTTCSRWWSAQPAAGAAGRLRGQGGPLARGVAGAHRPALGRLARLTGPGAARRARGRPSPVPAQPIAPGRPRARRRRAKSATSLRAWGRLL